MVSPRYYLESAVSRAAAIPRVDELDGVVERGGRSCGGDMDCRDRVKVAY